MNKVLEILLNEQFKHIGINNWFKRTYYYMIDSKYRVKKRLTKFLADQLVNPSQDIKLLAYSLRGKDQEETIINILKWVKSNIRYKSDSANWGKLEYWGTAKETINRGAEDCDNMNSLIYVLARIAGIGKDQLYCMIGKVKIGDKLGGHFWLTFWSTDYDKLVTIDSTYYVSTTSVKNRPRFFLNKNRYNIIWFIFNESITLKTN